MSADRRTTGRTGEQAACRYLASLGWRILQTNWRCRAGELDIVAEDGPELVFVEVRTRSVLGSFGGPLESVNPRKQRKVRQVAGYYLREHRQQERSVRFDAIGVVLSGAGGEPDIAHIRHAF